MDLPSNLGVQVVEMTLADAYVAGVRAILENGVLQPTGRNEQFGTHALTVNGMQIWIDRPLMEPMVSDMSPNDYDYCRKYAMEYCILGRPTEGDEEYTYAEYANKNGQIVKAIQKIRDNPYLRDCIIQIADCESIDKESPQCLRMVGVRRISESAAVEGEPDVVEFMGHAIFRSWDYLGAANANIYGCIEMCRYVLHEANPDYELTKFLANGIDTHIYEKQLHGPMGAIERFKPRSVASWLNQDSPYKDNVEIVTRH